MRSARSAINTLVRLPVSSKLPAKARQQREGIEHTRRRRRPQLQKQHRGGDAADCVARHHTIGGQQHEAVRQQPVLGQEVEQFGGNAGVG